MDRLETYARENNIPIIQKTTSSFILPTNFRHFFMILFAFYIKC